MKSLMPSFLSSEAAPEAEASATGVEEEPIDYDALELIMAELTSADPDPEACAELFELLGRRGQEMVMADATMGPKARELGLGAEDEGGLLWSLIDAGAETVGLDADAAWDAAEGAVEQAKDAGSGLIGSDWNPLAHPVIQQMEETASDAWEAFKDRTGLSSGDVEQATEAEEEIQEDAPEAPTESGPSPGDRMVVRPGATLSDANGRSLKVTEAVEVQVVEVRTVDATVTTTGTSEAGKKDSYHVKSVDPDGPTIDHYAGFGALAWAAEMAEDMRGATQIPLDKLKNSKDKKVASIWNDKGGYIDAARGTISRKVGVAVMCAESGGAATDGGGLPIIRFENHKLKRNSEGLAVDWGKAHATEYAEHFRYTDAQYGHEVNFAGESAGGKWEAFHGSQATEWRVFELASSLASREIAARCMSIGAGQVMGFNAAKLGYDSAEAMLDDMTSDVKANVGGVFKFIEANPTAKAALERGDYVGFAAEYNGDKYKDGYGAIISEYAGIFERLEAAWLSGENT